MKTSVHNLDSGVYDQRNGYSNRNKLMGSSYHASSLSFSKNNNKLNSKQAAATIHSTYNGTTGGGIHSHNSSIHSSHMKSRSPGNSQLSTMQNKTGAGHGAAQQVIVNSGAANGPGSLQMHHFHPSGTLH